jgi:hypothetical protein
LPEVGGDAVEYTDTTSTAIGSALSDLLAKPARRRTLSDAAIIRAASFTWSACLDAHRAVWLV